MGNILLMSKKDLDDNEWWSWIFYFATLARQILHFCYVLHQHNRGKTNMHCIVLELEYKPRQGIVFIKNKQAFCKYDSYSRFKINVCLDLLVRLNRTLLSFLIFLLAEPFNTNSKWSDFLSKIFKKTKTGSKESIKIYNLFIV